ncbi:MAG: archaellin/type IV pilin N-terminal domain-containing protein [Christensenella sp.]
MKSLKQKIDAATFKLFMKQKAFIEELKSDERGVSPIVATVLVILIAVVLAALFSGYLRTWFEGVWEKINGATNSF